MNFMSGVMTAEGLQGRMELTPYTGTGNITSDTNSLFITIKGIYMGSIKVDTLDSNCGVCHIHEWMLDLPTESIKEVIEYIELIAKESKYGRIMSGLTKRVQHKYINILLEMGWEIYDEFKSPRTGNVCVFLRKNLT